ncbi:hypothetical protein [Spirosoma spitsbergense]|uniref:hypothetical protein n=1 Tax=Spirosoma spitsbergense TaxID=431554 RepID=UPI0004767970|nr:hypothetical protein [Spirosoma spitsbergense]
MNTRLLMVISAFFMGSAGLLLSFFPQELLTYWGVAGTPPVFLQLLGALYFSFAMVNWTAKANLIGGIYSRPISTGNFAHFLIGSLAFDKLAFISSFHPALVGAGLIYSIFAILFGYVFFTHPG